MTTLDQDLDTVAEAMKPLVASIESKPAITQNRYDAYMAAISVVADKIGKGLPKSVYIAIGVSLQRAGANKLGVQSALRAMGHL